MNNLCRTVAWNSVVWSMLWGCNTDPAQIGRDLSGGAGTTLPNVGGAAKGAGGSITMPAAGGATMALGGSITTPAGGKAPVGGARTNVGGANLGGSITVSGLGGAVPLGGSVTTPAGGKAPVGGARTNVGGANLGGSITMPAAGGATMAIGGSITMPAVGGGSDTCGVVATSPGPYPTTLRFYNDTIAPLWLWQGCSLEFSMNSCHDNYAKPVVMAASCSLPCGSVSGSGCIACGACFVSGKQIAAGSFVDYSWPGLTYSYATENGCTCHLAQPAAPGVYRVTIPVWTSDPDPNKTGMGSPPAPSYSVTKYFALSEAGAVQVIGLRGPGCTYGADQTCNDLLETSSLWGQCLTDGTCQCHEAFVVNPATGRCTMPTLVSAAE